MYIPRLYFNQFINLDTIIELKKNTIHYCLKVIKLRINSIIHIFNNTNYIFISKIIYIKKNKIFVKIIEKKKDDKESPINIHLGQIVSKKMNITIEKSVELGVKTITPIISRNKKFDKQKKNIILKKNYHWNKIIISACSQSQRNILPILNNPCSIYEWCNLIPYKSTKIICNLNSINKIHNIPYKYKNIYILIGSETGFNEKEIKYTQEKNFLNVSLGPRVLRTETASMVAITALQIYFGDI
ncbi:Ribosomal RNA small subunit methyltransferase E [Buchnera aphidicola (Cinara piceae)]|uniref:Ribosomal RNA small subunit methyltransferase E n=1 Tax=Buchnera aphidicola (Cinara piceae) TaxID=1660043 RepID=A0A803FU32_9GAMM|nr:16S rRNA (uracil(1498)-N(3))-methyltransferase [Buchnera aphidicola]VFP88518.1 Ribosomal RNA small subunit methyltransferase E [Buchnera aphidicola (Cinara piceae)]